MLCSRLQERPDALHYISSDILPKELLEFDDQTQERISALTRIKRTYTLKLFAGGEEAKELFASLAKELAAIVK
jgi:hypothetical protein